MECLKDRFCKCPVEKKGIVTAVLAVVGFVVVVSAVAAMICHCCRKRKAALEACADEEFDYADEGVTAEDFED